MITPLRGRDELDVPGLEGLIEHIVGGGVHGLFILGTTGEAPSLSYRLRRELVDRVSRQLKQRVPLLVGVTDTSWVELLSLARHAAEAGASALVLSAPYYFPPGQSELYGFIKRLLPELPLPVFLYNMPQMTKVAFTLETLRSLTPEHKIIGVKDSSGNLNYFRRLVALKGDRPDWSLLVGPEELLVEALRCGGDGGVNGGANLHPHLLCQLFDAVERRDEQRTAELNCALLLLGGIYSIRPDASSVICGLKCACALTGLFENDFMAEPFLKFGAAEREKIRTILREAKLLPGSSSPVAGTLGSRPGAAQAAFRPDEQGLRS